MTKMKSLSIILMFSCIFLYHPLQAQDAINSYLSRGAEAVESDDFDRAKDILKDGEKHFKNSGDRKAKERFRSLQKKLKKLELARVEYTSAKISVNNNHFMMGLESIVKSRKSLTTARSDYEKTFEPYEKDFESRLNSLKNQVETDRPVYWRAELEKGKQDLSNQSLDSAAEHLRNAKRESTESEQRSSGMMAPYKIAEAYMKEERGDELMSSRKYVDALTSYEESHKLEPKPSRRQKIDQAREKACERFMEYSLLDIYEMEKESQWLLRSQATNRSCSPEIIKLFEDANSARKLVKDADKVEESDKKRALSMYKEAYVLVPAPSIKRKIDELD